MPSSILGAVEYCAILLPPYWVTNLGCPNLGLLNVDVVVCVPIKQSVDKPMLKNV